MLSRVRRQSKVGRLIGLIGIIRLIGLIGIIGIIGAPEMEAKKIKQSLKVTKEKTSINNKGPKNKGSSKSGADSDSNQLQLPADTISHVILKDGSRVVFNPDSISFSGYEKEANSSLETLLITNSGNVAITGVRFRIIYKDLKDRMLHSRTITQNCHIPVHETRRVDFKTWDNQKTYFYYLGNEPKKVATPYKVEIVAVAFFY